MLKISMKNFSVFQDEETKLPNIRGKFVVMLGDKEIAEQDFNGGYGSKKIPFSGDVIHKAKELEGFVNEELVRMLS